MRKLDGIGRRWWARRTPCLVSPRSVLALAIASVHVFASTWAKEPATLATRERREHFVEHVALALAVDSRLTGKARRDQVKQRLWMLIDHELDQVGLPAIPGRRYRVWFDVAEAAPLGASFNYRDWQIILDKKLVDQARRPEKAVELGELLYHELRHVEQHYLLGRWLVAQGRVREIYRVLPRFFAEAARYDALPAGPLAKTVARWYAQFTPENQATLEAFTSACNAVRSAVKRREKLAKRLAEARARKRDGGLRQQLEREFKGARFEEGLARQGYRKLLPRYKHLPFEADAYKVAGRLRTLLARRLAE
ncbi:MAG TPA: hypothetical protein VH877_29295 [Polyangia bacterium]|jgi:hypothetical protein|nr:hypothetical protein [Polyangia bacterium]